MPSIQHAVCTAPDCSKPAPDGSICPACLVETRTDLETCEWLWGQLEVTRTRQGNTAKDRVRCARMDEQPLPWVPQAAEAAKGLESVVVELATGLAPHSGCPDIVMRIDRRVPVTLALVEWLLIELDALPRLPSAGRHLRALDSAMARGMAVIDHPEDEVFLGRCGGRLPGGATCPVGLMAVVGEPVVVCWRCKRSHDVSDRQDEMMWRAREYVTHAVRMSSLMTLMGIPTAASTIRGYAMRRGLQVISVDAHRRPQYRVRDVMALRMASFGRERSRAAARVGA